MKKLGDYTMRGILSHQSTEKLTLFDGRFDTGFRVVEFLVGPNNITGAESVFGTVFTDPDGSGANTWKWDDNVQIAWAGCASGTDSADAPYSVVDPDNLVIEDLYIRGSASSSGDINYMLILEKYQFSEWRGALAMVRARSQNVGST